MLEYKMSTMFNSNKIITPLDYDNQLEYFKVIGSKNLNFHESSKDVIGELGKFILQLEVNIFAHIIISVNKRI